MLTRKWWGRASVAAGILVSGGALAQLPGELTPLPTVPAGPGPATGPATGADLGPVSGPLPSPGGAQPAPMQPVFRPAEPVQLPPPTVTQLPGLVSPAQPASPVPQPAPLPPQRQPQTLVATPPVQAQSGPGQPALSVKQTLPESVAPGQPVSAEITVTNVGTKAADSVVLTGWWTPGYDLSDQSVASQSINGKRAWGMGAIPAGESRIVRVKFVPGTSTPPTTEFRSGFDATFSTAVNDTRSVKVLKPEVKVAVSAPEQVFVGQAVPVHIRVTNASAIPVQKVVVQSYLSGGVAHPKMPAGTGGLASDPVNLMPGGTDAIPLDLVATRVGEGKVTVRVLAEGADPVVYEVTVKAVEARVAVTMNGPKALYQNWPATFEAVIENQGDHPIRTATFEVKLPPGLTENLRASDRPGYDAASNRLVWKFDVLQPGEKKTVLWFGYSKQADDLTTTGTATVNGMPLKRAEWLTKNLGAEGK